jgi:hypothetical protein
MDDEQGIVGDLVHGSNSNICNYMFRSPVYKHDAISGALVGQRGSGPLGDLRCQTPGAGAVYNNQQLSFPPESLVMSRTYNVV